MTKTILCLSEFNVLPKELQYELLQQDGVYVGKRKIANSPVILFQLYSFYVEIHYKVYRTFVDYIITSENTEILQPYLNQIYVKDLQGVKEKN